MTTNAGVAATAIATYLVEVGVLSIADQISAIRRNYAQTWKATLLRHGFDDVADMPVADVADGVDLALSRLVDAAQEEYAAMMATATGSGKSHVSAAMAAVMRVQP